MGKSSHRPTPDFVRDLPPGPERQAIRHAMARQADALRRAQRHWLTVTILGMIPVGYCVYKYQSSPQMRASGQGLPVYLTDDSPSREGQFVVVVNGKQSQFQVWVKHPTDEAIPSRPLYRQLGGPAVEEFQKSLLDNLVTFARGLEETAQQRPRSFAATAVLTPTPYHPFREKGAPQTFAFFGIEGEPLLLRGPELQTHVEQTIKTLAGLTPAPFVKDAPVQTAWTRVTQAQPAAGLTTMAAIGLGVVAGVRAKAREERSNPPTPLMKTMEARISAVARYLRRGSGILR